MLRRRDRKPVVEQPSKVVATIFARFLSHADGAEVFANNTWA